MSQNIQFNQYDNNTQILSLFVMDNIWFQLCQNISYKMMRLLRISINNGFSRKVQKKKYSYDQLIQYKRRKLNRYLSRYSAEDAFEHQDKFYEEFLYGHSCHIAAATQGNFASQKFAKSVIKYAKPNLLILGGLSDNYLRFYQHIFKMRQKYEHPLHKPQKMICRERMENLIQKRLQYDGNLYWDEEKQQIIDINHKDRRIVPADYLTVAYMASLQGGTKIILGKPSDQLVFQDIIMRYSLDELAQIVERAVQHVQQNQNQSNSLEESYTQQAIQNYVMSQQPSIYSRELTYQTALLKRFAKVEDKIVHLTPGYFVHRIAEQVHQSQVKPQNVFRDGINDPNSQSYYLLQKTLRTNDIDQILQKFALIVLMKENWIQKQFARDINVFKYMSFAALFENIEVNELKGRYLKAKEKASTKWYELMKHRINNFHILPQLYTKVTLQDQFKTIQDRSKLSFPYTYEQKNYLSDHQNKVKLMNLQEKMKDMLNEEGDKHNIEIFDKFIKGFRSREGIILYTKLLGKANVESVQRIKLPIFHYAAFRGIYKQYLRQFILKANQNSTQIQRRLSKKIQTMEQETEKVMKQLDNPYELNKYLTGQKGKALHFNLDNDDGAQFSLQNIEQLKKIYSDMSLQEQKELEQEYGADWFKPYQPTQK